MFRLITVSLLSTMAILSCSKETKKSFKISNTEGLKPATHPLLVYKNEGVAEIYADPEHFKPEDPIYAVQLPFNWTQEQLVQYGNVLKFQPGMSLMELTESQRDELAIAVHEAGMGCGGPRRLENLSETKPNLAVAPLMPLQQDPQVQSIINHIDGSTIKEVVESLSSLSTRHHNSETGKKVAEGMLQKYKSLWNESIPVTFEEVKHTGTNQPSFRVRIEGTSQSNEVLVLGSHIDSIARGGAAPGADDNASGTGTNLEIFKMLMEHGKQPTRTIEIHGYAAEEIGLVGSSEMAREYKSKKINVLAMLQFDMNLYKETGSQDKIWFVSNNTNADFNTQLEKLVDLYVKVPYARKSLFGGSSDHASWNSQGFVAAFPFENPQGYNNSIHTPNDTIAKSGAFSQAASFAKLGFAYLAHFGYTEFN